MKVLLGSIAAAASGQIGGLVASRNRYGPYFRNNSSPVNPNTAAQQLVRSAMTQATQRWRDVVTAAQREGWQEYANGTPLRDVFGLTQVMSGNVMYVRVNAILIRYGETPIDDAPVTPGQGGQMVPTITGDVATGINLTAFTPSLVAGDFIQISESDGAVSQARNFFNGPFAAFGALSAGDVVLPFVMRVGAAVAIGQRWFYRFRIILADGKVGPPAIGQVDILT